MGDHRFYSTGWRDRRLWFFGALLLAIFATNLLSPGTPLMPFMFVPMVGLATFAGPRVTAGFGVLTLALVGVNTVVHRDSLQSGFGLRVVAMVLIAVLAVVLAYRVDVRERWLRGTLAGVTDGVLELDGAARCRWASSSLRNLIDGSTDSIIGRPVAELFHEGDRSRIADFAAPGTVAVADRVVRLARADGGFVRVSVTWVAQDDGAIVGLRSVEDEMAAIERLVDSEVEARSLAASYDAAREEAEQATTMKTQFLSRMSHELRTPLNAILGFAELLALEDLTSEQRSSLVQIELAGQHLLSLLSEVLDVARIEAGRMSLSVEPVEAVGVVRRAISLSRGQAASRGVTLEIGDGTPERAIVLADEQRLLQVLLNLLSNAVKYNREGGRISILVEERDGETAIRLADTGVGIAPEDMGRLFVAFERLGADDSPVQGTGMGLMLSRGLTEAMSGRVEVDSRLGEGSVFSVILRTGEDAPGSPDVGLAAPAAPAGVGGARVLYIDDNEANLALMRAICRQRDGVALTCAGTGAEGIRLARTAAPQLVFLDVHLPDISGLEVLARLRLDPGTAEVPIVLLTADPSVGLRQEASRMGATDLLGKPLSIPRVLDWIDDPDRRPRSASPTAVPP